MPVVADGFEAKIKVDGNELEEYWTKWFVDEHGVPVVECFVPSVAGKPFEVVCTFPAETRRKRNLAVDLRLDGYDTVLPNCYIHKDRSVTGPTKVTFDGELMEGDSAVQGFEFGKLEITDDDSCRDVDTKSLGLIQVEIYSYLSTAPKSRPAYIQEERWTDYRIHEKSKKLVAHCVKFGEVKPNVTESTFVGATGTSIICHFHFHYRDKDLLVTEEIVPSAAAVLRRSSSVRLSRSRSAAATAAPPIGRPEPRMDTPATTVRSRNPSTRLAQRAVSSDRATTNDSEMDAMNARALYLRKVVEVKARIVKLEAQGRRTQLENAESERLMAHLVYLKQLVAVLSRLIELVVEKNAAAGLGRSDKETGPETQVHNLEEHADALIELVETQAQINQLQTRRLTRGSSQGGDLRDLEAHGEELKALVDDQARVIQLNERKRARSETEGEGEGSRFSTPKRVKTEPSD